MSALDSSAPPNPAATSGNLPAIQYLPHPPNDLGGYHPQQSPMGHMPPHPSPHAMQQQPNAYLPQHTSYMPPNSHYSAQPAPYDNYPPPPPHQAPYGAVPHFTHSPHPPTPYGHQFHPEYHHDSSFQYPSQYRNYITDPSGQSGPPGMKPRVTTTLWEDEGTLCFQVEAKGICVARREDNNMINGTKLLNVAGMSRGKRDGILKSEKARAVVKVGAMHLKGVWIPFDRALDFANKERIIDMLYPLFVDDIKSFLYHPANYARTNAVMAAAANRQAQTSPNVVSFNQPSQVPRRSSDGRPIMSERSMSFPTPPSSASSITNGTADLPWGSHTGLSLDTSGIPPVTRSLPGTPATSPSSAVHAGSQTYAALTDSHLHRQSLQFEPSFKREAITALHLSYPTGSQFSSRRASSASDMGPPPATVHSRVNTLDKDQLDVKHEPLPESQEEGYQNDLHYNVPPGTPISASSNQVYNTPSIVAMKGRVDNPGTPTHTHSPSGNVGWSQKHEPPSQNDYAISSQTHHARQLSYQIRGTDDQGQMVSQNGVSRNIFDSTPVDRDSKLSSLDYGHGDDVLHGDMPNGHNLSHGSLPSIKQEQLIKDGPPSSKRRRTINQDSLPYNLGGPSPTQSTADLSIPEGGIPTNGSVMHASDQGGWNPYTDEYGTVLGDPSANGRKRPPSRK